MQSKKQLKAVSLTAQKQIAGGHIGDTRGPEWSREGADAFREQVEREAQMLQDWWDSFVSLF